MENINSDFIYPIYSMESCVGNITIEHNGIVEYIPYVQLCINGEISEYW